MKESEFVKQIKTKSRRGNPNWKKGQSGNPNGRPRRPEVDLLREALEKAKEKKGKEFLEHFVERAYTNDAVGIALARKLLPDQQDFKVDTERDREEKARARLKDMGIEL